MGSGCPPGYCVAAAFSRDSVPFMGSRCPSWVQCALLIHPTDPLNLSLGALMPLLLGLDIGTTGARVIAVDERGAIIAAETAG
jgi:hypothetical protein